MADFEKIAEILADKYVERQEKLAEKPRMDKPLMWNPPAKKGRAGGGTPEGRTWSEFLRPENADNPGFNWWTGLGAGSIAAASESYGPNGGIHALRQRVSDVAHDKRIANPESFLKQPAAGTNAKGIEALKAFLNNHITNSPGDTGRANVSNLLKELQLSPTADRKADLSKFLKSLSAMESAPLRSGTLLGDHIRSAAKKVPKDDAAKSAIRLKNIESSKGSMKELLTAARELAKKPKLDPLPIGQRRLWGRGRIGAATVAGGLVVPSLIDFLGFSDSKSAPLK